MVTCMRKLLIYLKDYKKETILAPLFKMLEATFELFVPLVVAAIIDVGIGKRDTAYVLRMGGILIALGLIGLACSITAQYFAAKAAVGFSTKLKHALFDHIQSLSFTEIDTLGTSTMITRMTSDANQVQNGVNMVLRLFLRSPFIVFGAMVMAFTIDVKAALIFVVTIPLLSIVVFGIMVWTMPMYRKVQSNLDQVLGSTRENLTGARVIRAFNKEQEEIAGFEQAGIPIKRGTLMAESSSQIDNMENVFAGGDCVTGPATAIRAIAAGKVAAANIDEQLGFHHEIRTDVEIPAPHLDVCPARGRVNTKEREAAQRKCDFEDIECGMTHEEACAESGRCLRCDHFGYGIFKGGRIERW